MLGIDVLVCMLEDELVANHLNVVEEKFAGFGLL